MQGQRQEFSIKCECIISKNNLQVNGKKKSKFSIITLHSQKKVLTAQPFGSQKDEEILSFPLAKLKGIHKRYIEEGKLTLEFLERTERLALKGVDVANTDNMVEVRSQILISSASRENLELLIEKIIEMRASDCKKSSNGPPPPKEQIKKKPAEIKEEEEEKVVMVSRKELMSSAMHPQTKRPPPLPQKPRLPTITFFDLPAGIINSVLEYSGMTLAMRLINRRFSEHVLRNIQTVRLRDEVDQKTFNKLSKWAVEVECRMKNVRNLELADQYEQQELLPGRAKTLRFGGWREVSAKNILQLKGLRIYCLQLPYTLKFDLSHLFGLRLVELRLKSPQLTASRCQQVRTEDLAYLLKTVQDLRVIELPYAFTDLLTAIEHPARMTEIRTYYLNDNSKDDSWKDFSRFANLKILSVWIVQRGGAKREEHQVAIKLPQGLLELEIGHFLSQESLEKLPVGLQQLKLIGKNFFNHHIDRVYLPNLKQLDISMSRNVRQDVLECMQDLSIITFWDRTTVDLVAPYARSKGIRLTTRNPDFK